MSEEQIPRCQHCKWSRPSFFLEAIIFLGKGGRWKDAKCANPKVYKYEKEDWSLYHLGIAPVPTPVPTPLNFSDLRSCSRVRSNDYELDNYCGPTAKFFEAREGQADE